MKARMMKNSAMKNSAVYSTSIFVIMVIAARFGTQYLPANNAVMCASSLNSVIARQSCFWTCPKTIRPANCPANARA
jgi:hypothetical protein